MGAKLSTHIQNRCNEFGTQPYVKYDMTKRRRPPKWLKDYPKGKFSEYLEPNFVFDEHTLNFLQESFVVLAEASWQEMARPLPQNINQLYIESQNQETQFSYNFDPSYRCVSSVAPAPLLPPNYGPVGLSPLVTFGLMGLGFVYSWQRGKPIPPTFPHTF